MYWRYLGGEDLTMGFTNEVIDRLDDNNMKAKEILRVLMCLIGSEELT